MAKKSQNITLAEWRSGKEKKLAVEEALLKKYEDRITEVYLSIKDFVHSSGKTQAGIDEITELKGKVAGANKRINNLKKALR
jgi:hypothetical protein